MRLIARVRGRCYCAFCRSPRKIYVKKHVDGTNVLLTLALAIGATSVVSGGFDARAAVMWPTLLIAAEIFIYLRWRFALTCNLCGFDPIAYKRSPQEAARKVGEFFNRKINSADFMLSRSPLLKVYKDIQARRQKLNEYERVLGKKNNTSALPMEAPKAAPNPSIKSKGSQISRTV